MSDHPKYGDMMRVESGTDERLMMYVGPDPEPDDPDVWRTFVVITTESPTVYPEGHVAQWRTPDTLAHHTWIEDDD